MRIKKIIYRWAVAQANRVANKNEGLILISKWDKLAASLWEPQFED
jgi:hypothetical protein